MVDVFIGVIDADITISPLKNVLVAGNASVYV